MNLLGFADAVEFLPFILVPIIFVIVFICITVAAVKRYSADKRKKEMDEYKSKSVYVDGNGRTEHQREYLNSKRKQLAEKKISSADGSHSHVGKTETYQPIVGSLGVVNDEGCDELDGVRLLEHDEAYCDDPDHILWNEPTELERAIVLGEVINAPRFKQPYRRRK